MTSTNASMAERDTSLAGFSLVLTPADFGAAPALDDWFTQDTQGDLLRWVPLRPEQGVLKVMPVLKTPEQYPTLVQDIYQRLIQGNYIAWKGRSYNLSGVEVTTQDMHVVQLLLSPEKALPPTLGRALHACCFEWIGAAAPELAAELHPRSPKPLTISARPISGRQLLLKIAVLHKPLLSPLLWGLSQHLGQEITLTDVKCRLAPQVELVASGNFQQLLQTPTQNDITLEFLSPTSFKQLNGNIQPFLLPELVFGSLWRRWNTVAPESLRFPPVEWNGMVSAQETKSYSLKMKGGAEIGSQGWVRYRFADPEQARIATVLSHFALFSGVGRKTAMGMGQARIAEGPPTRSKTKGPRPNKPPRSRSARPRPRSAASSSAYPSAQPPL